MGLFDSFSEVRGSTAVLTKDEAKILGLMCVALGDLNLNEDKDEIWQTRQIELGLVFTSSKIDIEDEKNKSILESMVTHMEELDIDDIANMINSSLDENEKISLTLNMLDIALSDGIVEYEEEKALNTFIETFNVDRALLEQAMQILMLKHSIF